MFVIANPTWPFQNLKNPIKYLFIIYLLFTYYFLFLKKSLCCPVEDLGMKTAWLGGQQMPIAKGERNELAIGARNLTPITN
jgi:hypothetical protein